MVGYVSDTQVKKLFSFFFFFLFYEMGIISLKIKKMKERSYQVSLMLSFGPNGQMPANMMAYKNPKLQIFLIKLN